LYNEVPEINDNKSSVNVSPWLLRLKLDVTKVVSRALDMQFISKKLEDTFQD